MIFGHIKNFIHQLMVKHRCPFCHTRLFSDSRFSYCCRSINKKDTYYTSHYSLYIGDDGYAMHHINTDKYLISFYKAGLYHSQVILVSYDENDESFSYNGIIDMHNLSLKEIDAMLDKVALLR